MEAFPEITGALVAVLIHKHAAKLVDGGLETTKTERLVTVTDTTVAKKCTAPAAVRAQSPRGFLPALIDDAGQIIEAGRSTNFYLEIVGRYS
jgi:hypothetical protein